MATATDNGTVLPLDPPRPAPEAPAQPGRLARPGWLSRLRYRLRSWRSAPAPAPRDRELALEAEAESLRRRLWERDCRIHQLEHDLARRDSENKILQHEVALWAEVHFRDRARAEADHAVYNQLAQIAAGLTGRGGA